MIFKSKNKRNKSKIIAIIILIGGIFLEFYYFITRKKKIKDIEGNIKEFVSQEKKEFGKFTHGQESFNKFYCHSCSIFKDYFIPHEGNDHKPKILRPKSLAIIVILLTLLKATATSYLFLVYPGKAGMSNQISTEILYLSNQDRLKNNLDGLKLNSVLSTAALAKAENMIINNYFAHTSPDGKKPWDWINRSEYDYMLVGENLAMNFSSAKTAHEALMQSPLHKKNILNNKYQDIGLAVVSGKIKGKETNLLVELFGAQKTAQKLAVSDKQTPLVKATTTVGVNSEKSTNIGVNITEVLGSETTEKEIKQDDNATTTSNFLEDKKIDPRISAIASLEDQIIFNSEKVSPNLKLNNGIFSDIYYNNIVDNKNINQAANLAIYLRYFYITILIIMIALLLVNIFVKIKIQHKPVIIQTVITIILIAGLLSLRLSMLENIFERVIVI